MGHAVSRIAAVVVTHNRLAALQKTVSALLDEGVDRLHVVDNASTDGTSPWLATLADGRVHVTRLPQNRGGAGGFAEGLARALCASDADWFLLVDDDARPLRGALRAFRDRAWTSGGVAAAVFDPEGRICEPNRPSRNPFWCWRTGLGAFARGRRGFHIADAAYGCDAPVAIDAASFAGLFLHRSCVEACGLPEPDFFVHGEDTAFTLRLRSRGIRLVFDPMIRFEHDNTSSEETCRGRRYAMLWQAYYAHRNTTRIHRVAAGPAFWLVAPLLGAVRVLRLSRFYGPRAGRVLALALWDGLRNVQRPHSEVLELVARRARCG